MGLRSCAETIFAAERERTIRAMAVSTPMSYSHVRMFVATCECQVSRATGLPLSDIAVQQRGLQLAKALAAKGVYECYVVDVAGIEIDLVERRSP